MPHLLNISIGPVQEFIASARRCQDLWYGSWLLSELSRTVAGHLEANGAQSLIFPGGLAEAEAESKDASVANKVLAVFDIEEPLVRRAAEGAREAMQARLEGLAKPILWQVYKGLTGEDVAEARRLADAQVQDLMEFQWVAVPIEGGDYPAARQQAERLLAAVKNTRPWSQPSWSRAGWRKSSLDGVRESVIPERFFKGEGSRAAMTEEELFRQFRVRKSERLCGVGLLKRWGSDPEAGLDKPNRFHSTSHMAAQPVMERARAMAGDENVRAAWSVFLECIKSAPFQGRNRVAGLAHPLFQDYDGSILYPSRITELFFAGEDVLDANGIAAGHCERAQAALRNLLKALEVSEPNAYYALLLADGDRMGAAIDNQGTIEAHQALSQALDGFASGARAIVRQHGGSLIYSGGDDVLAMLPLHTCLDCSEALAGGFATRLERFQTAEGSSPTLSVGIAIAHHLEDFADVRAWAGQAETLAKKRRNSLAIRLEKRGGSPIEASGSWAQEKEGDIPFLMRLRDWIGRHHAGEVPNKLPFQWADLIRLAKDNPAMNPIVMMDALRLVARKGDREAGTKDVSAIQAYLRKQVDPAVLESLSNELVLAKEIERAMRQAEAPHAMQETR